eukprot:jgi/Chrzof1/9125/Cz03g36260.t1_ECH3[v5.2]
MSAAKYLYIETLHDPSTSQDTGVRVLHLNKPESLNSLTSDMAEEFTKALNQLRADTALRALVVTGEGRAFSAGGDYGFIEDRIKGDKAANIKVLASFYQTFLQIAQLPVPTIAAVNGPAVGGGMGFAMACDMRLASTQARFSFNFVKLGLSPGMASTHILPNVTNYQVACRMLLTGDLIRAEEAKQLGIVLDVHEPDQLLPAATQLASRIAAASPAAVSATLQLLRQQQGYSPEKLHEAAQLEAEQQAVAFAGKDILEGLAAVREKRAPKFKC